MTGFNDSYAQLQCAMGGEGRFQKLNKNDRRSGGERRDSEQQPSGRAQSHSLRH
jgi:hypothetical protein